MSLLTDIHNAAIDGSSDLESLLRICSVLATKLKHEELKNWVLCELDGYPKEIALPGYRKWKGTRYGNFIGAMGRALQNCPIQETDLPEKLRQTMSHKHFTEGVGALKSLGDSVEGPSLRFGWPAETCHIVRPSNMAPDLVLAQGWI